MDLAAIEEIKRVKYRYLRCLDQKRWDELADTLAPDATATYGTAALGEELTFTGREAILGFLRERLGYDIITVHVASQPEIDVGGAVAQGIWCLEDTVIATEYQVLIRGSAFYEDRYRRCEDGAWRIQHTGYERTYEAMLSLSDLPSFQLIANRWASASDSAGS